jgi:hypothetical protein
MPSPSHYYGWTGVGLPRRRFPALALDYYPPLPPQGSVITTGFLPPIWDQGQTSSCVGHGTTRAIAYARAKQGLPYVDLSRLFPYWNARVVEGGQATDSGASVGDGIAASLQFGDCPYTDLPTDAALVTTQPSSQIFANAIKHRAFTATRIFGANPTAFQYRFKHCIDLLGFPVVFGFTVYESFESDQVANTGVAPMPGPNEQIVGGHCVAAVAYDDTTQLVTCDNSWNTTWGQAGRFQLPYSYIFDPDMADDFHAILSDVG